MSAGGWSIDRVVREAERLRPRALDAFLDSGGKAVGYVCAATPVEVLDAAGVLPYRIRALGRQERSLADSRMSRFNCSYCRSCLQLCMDGSFDFLAGVVETNGCDHLRGMFENWQAEKPDRFFHYLRVPHLTHADAVAVFREELGLYRDAVAALAGREISDEDLAAAVAVRERNRRLLEEVLALRAADPPRLTGAEALALQLLESAVPPAEFERILRGVRPGLSGRRLAGQRARLFFGGSATDELPLVRRLEQVGVAFVADGLCYGSRGTPLAVEPGGDVLDALVPRHRDSDRSSPSPTPAGGVARRLHATSMRSPRSYPASAGARRSIDRNPCAEVLAGAYLGGLLCPRMFMDYERRLAHYLAAARGAGAHGALLMHNKFCDLHGVDNVQLRNDMEAAGLPVLLVEKEYGAAADLGRLETRLQAFLERIGR